MSKSELTVKPVETDEELRLAHDLMAKVQYPDYFSGLNWLEACGEGYPGFRREHTRIALWKGELAGALRMHTETIRLGEARLKMGGLGWVSTAQRHRRKGVCHALMIHTLDYLKQNHYHVSMLFGIPNFYHRFGFTTTLADYAIAIDTAEALHAPRTPYRKRPAKPGDIAAIQRIHAANDTDIACSLLRSSAHLTNKWDHCKNMSVLTSDSGKVLAYFTAHASDKQMQVSEVGVSAPQACSSVLAACGQLASDANLGRIRFLMPPPHPFARHLLQYQSTHEMRILRDQGAMLAFVDQAEALESLIPEWEDLLSRTNLRNEQIEITLVIDRVNYRVRARRGAIDIAQQSGANRLSIASGDLMHLVTGYRYLDDILAKRRRILTAPGRALLAALFPKRTPYVWTFDRF
ncbi:MAG: GNAT family N-acetyltransferase [Nitrospiraceae bacterium]|nr:GNAT family N-acetyltransferase [Nitrospiraceae bacterium]